MLRPTLRVAVIGCGTAGQAAAMYLSRAGGAHVTVFDKFRVPAAVGAGMLLQPTGCLALARLGLFEETQSHGARVERLFGADATTRRTVLDLRYSGWNDERGVLAHPAGAGGSTTSTYTAGLGIHRGALFHILHSTLLASTHGEGATALETVGSRISMSLGTNITGAVDVHAAEPVLTDDTGGTHGPFDLVLVAEGSASTLREKCAPPGQVRAPLYPWGAFWSVVRDDTGAFQGQLAQVYDRCSVMIGVLPVGGLPRAATAVQSAAAARSAHAGAPPGSNSGLHGMPSTATDCSGIREGAPQTPAGDSQRISQRSHTDKLLSFFWSVKLCDMATVRSRPLAEWKASVLTKWPAIAPLLEQMQCWDDVADARYRDVLMSSCHHDRFLYIGDAAHGTSPQLGQGANMALIDAMVLGAVYAHARDAATSANTSSPAQSTGALVGRTLRDYQAARSSHLWYYQTASRLLTPVFQSDSRSIGWLRDATFGTLCSAPFVGRQMVKTLVGMQSGVLGTWEPPPAAPLQPRHT